jgi:hypothetical protein
VPVGPRPLLRAGMLARRRPLLQPELQPARRAIAGAMRPVQLLVLGLADGRLDGELAEELRRLRGEELVRVLDVVLVTNEDGSHLRVSETGAGFALGMVRTQDIDLSHLDGAEAGELWSVAEEIPVGMTAVIALVEHRWAMPLQRAIARAGATPLAEEWVAPEDVASVGLGRAEASARPWMGS